MAASFYSATPGSGGITCDITKVPMTFFAAPTALGASWAGAQRGAVNEMTGILHPDPVSGFFEVQSMREIGRCP